MCILNVEILRIHKFVSPFVYLFFLIKYIIIKIRLYQIIHKQIKSLNNSQNTSLLNFFPTLLSLQIQPRSTVKFIQSINIPKLKISRASWRRYFVPVVHSFVLPSWSKTASIFLLANNHPNRLLSFVSSGKRPPSSQWRSQKTV